MKRRADYIRTPAGVLYMPEPKGRRARRQRRLAAVRTMLSSLYARRFAVGESTEYSGTKVVTDA